MPELVQGQKSISLWAGWSITLRDAYYERNEDGSWSSWGKDWSLDIHIIEVGPNTNGLSGSPEHLLPSDMPQNAQGDGWIGSTWTLTESDGTRDIIRLACTLAGYNSIMSCWISYLNENQTEFAVSLIQGVMHSAQQI